jgi:hypothetical protein
MSDFKSEHAELIDWLKKETEPLLVYPIPDGGLDGENAAKRGEIYKEYKRRVDELKKKYAADETSPKPAAIARPFGQIIGERTA